MTDETLPLIGQRFRGFLPVVVDVETAGFNSQTDALLEIAAIPIIYNEAVQKNRFIMKDIRILNIFHYESIFLWGEAPNAGAAQRSRSCTDSFNGSSF